MKGMFLTYSLVLLISAVIGGFLWPYTINTWLVFWESPQ